MAKKTQDPAIKAFMLENFDFDGLKEINFWPKGTRRNDHEAQAARVCQFFGYQSVFEYITKKLPPHHITEVAANFTCPICTCPGEVPNTGKIPDRFRCCGCKRKLVAYPKGMSAYTVEADDDKNDVTDTHL